MRRDKKLNKLEKSVDSIAHALERSRFYEYVEYVADGKNALKRAFLSGILRGFGMAIGFSLLGAFMIYILDVIARSKLPYIADFIAKLISIVEANRR